MREQKIKADRLAAFSDAMIAVIITVMVLELRAPDEATFSAILPLWPTVISYVVSYLFIAIIWLNHHHLLRFVGHTTPALMWVNFAHLSGYRSSRLQPRGSRAHGWRQPRWRPMPRSLSA